MVNIRDTEGNYSEAINIYQMALDHIPQEENSIGFKVCRNVGNAFFKIGKYHNAIHNYEAAMSSSQDDDTGVNALLCHVVLGYAEKVSVVLPKLCHCP